MPAISGACTLVPITNPKLVLAAAAEVAPVPPFEIAIAVPLQVPLEIVPREVILLLPVQVLNAVFSTLLSPTFDLLIPEASLASVTARSANFIVLILPSAIPIEATFAVT